MCCVSTIVASHVASHCASLLYEDYDLVEWEERMALDQHW